MFDHMTWLLLAIILGKTLKRHNASEELAEELALDILDLREKYLRKTQKEGEPEKKPFSDVHPAFQALLIADGMDVLEEDNV